MIGRSLGHYRVTAAIGAGGMGEVYRATDTKLSRDVALKVLPAEMAADPDRLERFQREARALAALDHPGIVSVFSVEEADGIHFLTMQLVEGETLDTVIAGGGLPLSRFLDISVPLADAISAAHERGIVHRDLKPGNVMVARDGRVKVLDFGLAKLGGLDSNPDLSSSPTGSRANLTGEGQVFGTVAYMSPEQARGAAVDARSDVFSLGVVLYQMLTGERPFTGTTAVDMISSILRDTPPSVTELRADLPPHLARVLRRCLEKIPRDRYQTSRDLYNELKELRAETASAAPVSSPGATAAPKPERVDSGSGRAPGQDSGRPRAQAFWIAVLPFTHSGVDPELESFAEGLAEDINAGLAKFPYLSVISRNANRRLKEQGADARAAGEQLAARYVVEGAIRKGASALRVNVQLVDTQTGAHLWAETYTRDLKDSDIFALQDGISGRVVATVADSYGVLVRSMTAMIQQKADIDLAPSEWLFAFFAYRQQLSPPAHTAMKNRLERAVERDAGQADLWACLAQVYTDEHKFGFRTDPTSLDRALAAARRAVELDRANQPGMVSLAEAYFFRRDLAAFRPAAEQAMALNRLNTDAQGILGLLIVHTGEFQRGAAIVRRAMELNPNHAGWFHFGPIWEHFHRGEYDRALEHAMQVNMPSWFWQPLVIAAISGQLDRPIEAASAVRDLLALDPGFAAHLRRDIEVWHFASGLLEPILEGVRRGGLTIADSSSSQSIPVSSPAPEAGVGARPPSDIIRVRPGVDEGFWVAVLPFRYRGTDPGLEALAEGLTEDIGTGLSRFSYLRVIARSSTSRYANEAVDVRIAGKELGARYVMEGNLRQAGAKLRLAVQLVDAISGAHLWAESYERGFSTDAVFELQDELVPRIVSTLADMNGALPRSLSEAVRGRAPEELTPYEAVLRSFGYFQRVNAEELAAARSTLEMAVRKAPEYSDAWAMLALLCAQEYGQGYGLLEDSLAVGSVAARRAVEAGSSNHLAHSSLAQVLFLKKEYQAFRNAAARAVALNPMDGATVALSGILLAYTGDWERGCAMTEQAMRLNRHFPGWYRLATIVNAYRMQDYRAAIDATLKIQMPGYFWTPVFCAAAYGQLGEREAARKALEELLAIRPEFGATARSEFSKWHEPELVEHFVDGLRKAGLEIPGEKGGGRISAAVRADEGFWIAVLPFKYGGGDADLTALSGGMSEEIVAGLSRFSYLRVITGGSTQRYAAETPDLREVGRELNARYVMNGSLRQVGARLRVAVQLVDAATGAQLWAETYERPFRDEEVFELQDDLVSRIVSTVGDPHGILPHNMSESLRGKSPDQLTPYEAVLRSFGFGYRSTAEEHAAVREGLERAVADSPGYADAWAMLSLIYTHEHAHGFNPLPDPLDRALQAARRAADAGPSNAMAYDALAWALFFRKDIPAFRVAAEESIALNPLSSPTLAGLGTLIAYSGEWGKGCALVERAVELNPRHPGWYRFALFAGAYRKRDYRGAVDIALKLNLPDFFVTHEVLAAAYGQLGEHEEARRAVRDLLRLKPDYPAMAREKLEKWFESDFVEHWLDGVRKAGLETAAAAELPASAAERARTSAPAASSSASGAARADEGFWVAVLPFKHGGGDADLATLADGLTSDIVTGLSRFSYLRVIARSSTARRADADGPADARSAGRELGARYVMEGTLRQAGSKLRLAVQIVDTASGAHLWAENYERDFRPEALFELQDDLVPRIVSTVADMNGALPRSLSEAVRGRAPEDLSPYEAVLRSFGYFERITPEELSTARSGLESAVRKAPDHADAWAMLALLCVQDYAQGFGLQADPLGSGANAARRAVDIAPAHHLAWFGLAQALFFQKEFESFRNAAERAVALNPMDGNSMAFLGELLTYAGFEERGMELAGRAKQLNSNHPGWYWYADFYSAYRQGDDRGALGCVLKVNMHAHIGAHFMMAAAYGQLGEAKAAGKALGELLKLKPDFPSAVRGMAANWWNPEYCERLIDGLRKAGMEIAEMPAPAASPEDAK